MSPVLLEVITPAKIQDDKDISGFDYSELLKFDTFCFHRIFGHYSRLRFWPVSNSRDFSITILWIFDVLCFDKFFFLNSVIRIILKTCPI